MGWSIGNILLDFTGGMLSMVQVSTVQYSTVHCTTLHYITVKYSRVVTFDRLVDLLVEIIVFSWLKGHFCQF